MTIDSFGAHGNNGYKTAKENFVWSGNGYKKPFAAERRFITLFGSIDAVERLVERVFGYTRSHYTILGLLLD